MDLLRTHFEKLDDERDGEMWKTNIGSFYEIWINGEEGGWAWEIIFQKGDEAITLREETDLIPESNAAVYAALCALRSMLSQDLAQVDAVLNIMDFVGAREQSPGAKS